MKNLPTITCGKALNIFSKFKQVTKNLTVKQSCCQVISLAPLLSVPFNKIISDNQCIYLPEDICLKVHHFLLFLAYCNDQTWELVSHI